LQSAAAAMKTFAQFALSCSLQPTSLGFTGLGAIAARQGRLCHFEDGCGCGFSRIAIRQEIILPIVLKVHDQFTHYANAFEA
jgi:hypothetical protein